jgi:hypothetical protein
VSKNLFLKKKQKTFDSSAAATLPLGSRIVKPARDIKVFRFFSSEKNALAMPSLDFAKLDRPLRFQLPHRQVVSKPA